MNDPATWRGFDLSARMRKIERAFNREQVTDPDDVPILVNTPCYFAFGSRDKPADYFTNPASMLAYQAQGYEAHLRRVNDDYVPYFMPWFGTGVLASAFGCQIRVPDALDDDPAVAGPCVTSPAEAARLTLPDPTRDGWMPRVLESIDFARAYGDLPVGLTDAIGNLLHLRDLNLRSNAIAMLPAGIARLQSLEYLDLRDNRLTELPNALGQLSNLRKLDLRWNRLATYPRCLAVLADRGCLVYT